MMFFNKKNVRVSLRDKKLVIETKSGINLYRFLINERIIPHTLCDGSGQCGKCKIRFTGGFIPKPTYKESLILAKVNIDAGYRLACQHSIKKDIEIETNDMISPKTLFTPKIDYPEPIKMVEKPIKTSEPAPEPTATASKTRPVENRSDAGPSDGVLLIQQRGGVRFFCYSAALDNIMSTNVVESKEPLKDLIDNNLVSDFLHNVLRIKDIDRVILIIEREPNYNTEELLGMIRYFKFELGTLLCEVIMPDKENHDIVRFFRLLNADRGQKLTFSLDMLDRVHYFTDKLVTDMKFESLTATNMLAITPRGKNAVTEFNDDLSVKSTEQKIVPTDAVTLTALLKFTKLLLSRGIIDSSFTIKSRIELSKNDLPLGMAVRIRGKDVSTGFYMFRDRFSELVLTQEELHALAQIRDHIWNVISYTAEKIGRVSGLIFYTASTQENLINLLFDLGFIPKELVDKTSYFPGDATVQAIRLFKERDIPSFIKENFDNVAYIDLDNDEIFERIRSKKRGL